MLQVEGVQQRQHVQQPTEQREVAEKEGGTLCRAGPTKDRKVAAKFDGKERQVKSAVQQLKDQLVKVGTGQQLQTATTAESHKNGQNYLHYVQQKQVDELIWSVGASDVPLTMAKRGKWKVWWMKLLLLFGTFCRFLAKKKHQTLTKVVNVQTGRRKC